MRFDLSLSLTSLRAQASLSLSGFSGGQEREGTSEDPGGKASPALGEGREGDRLDIRRNFPEQQRLPKSRTGCLL